jgi:hypothetical protein
MRLTQRFGKVGMWPIKAADRVAVTIGWLAVYNKNLPKYGEAEAISRAQEATLMTQPAARAKDLPELYATNELMNWALMFTNQLNQIYNMWTYDIPSGVKNRKFYESFLTMTALSISALWIYMIAHKKKPSEMNEEDVKQALKEQWINAIPLFGRNMAAIASGYKANAAPPFKISEAAYRAFSDSGTRKADLMAEGFSIMTGFPYIGTKRAKQAIETGDVTKLLGKKPKRRRRR